MVLSMIQALLLDRKLGMLHAGASLTAPDMRGDHRPINLVWVLSLFALTLFGGSRVCAQTLIMADGALWNTCSGTFYDSGGPAGNYGSLENLTATICPQGGAGSGPPTSVTFLSFDVQLLALTDQLTIYNGTNTSAPVLATGGFLLNLTGQTFTATGPSGCLTFRWTSDLLINSAGWEAVLNTLDAGTDASLAVCSNGTTLQLIGALGGDPDPGGSWTGPNGPHGPQYDPTTDAPGSYTYIVSGGTVCADTATVTINIVGAPNAGTNGTLPICASSAPVQLINSLGGTPQGGGSWTGPGGPHDGNFDPATDPAGNYTYTVAGTPPCANTSATVNVVITAPNAGTSASFAVCRTDAAFALISRLGGTPDAGGTWTGPDGPHGPQYDPSSDPGGSYTYTVTAGSCTATATLTITNVQPPNAGSNGTLPICASSAPVDLFTTLGGTPQGGGSWTGPGGPHDGSFDPATDPAGNYTYTVPGTPPCANATATVNVVITAPNAGNSASANVCSNEIAFPLISRLGGAPDAGGSWTGPGGPHGPQYDPATEPGGTYTYTVNAGSCTATATLNITNVAAPNAGSNGNLAICESSAAVNLITRLGGTPAGNGSWTGPGGPHGGTFDPATDPAGNYTYTVVGTAPCANATATVNVVISAPDAGTSASSTVCSSEAAFALIGRLGGSPDAGGSWVGPGGPHGPQFNPATDQGGVYTYTVTAGSCTATATLTITRMVAPNAGTNGNIQVCESSLQVNLINSLGGLPNGGGSWSGPGGAHDGSFDPATDPPGVYVYTVTGTAPCVNASATVNVAITGPDAGTNASLTICSSESPFPLRDALGGSPAPGGSWTGPNGPYGAQYDPGTEPGGVYTYTVTAGSCVSSATLTITNVPRPNAGTSATLQICESSTPVALITGLGGTPQGGGSWTGPGGAFGGTFNPAIHLAGAYTYTVMGALPCSNATATLTVQITAPNAGNDAQLTVCNTQDTLQLIGALGGNPTTGGTWAGPGGAHGPHYVPATEPGGAYTYTVMAGSCSASATLTITNVTAPNAGTNQTLQVCESSTPVPLFNALGGAPNAGGSWTGPNGQHNGSFDPATDQPGTYLYTVAGTAPCANANATITVVIATPNAGTNTALSLCSGQPAFQLLSVLGGNPDPGGSWTGPGGPHGPQFDPGMEPGGEYTYTVTAGSCVATATLTITTLGGPDAGENGTLQACVGSGPVALFNSLGGSPIAGGSWAGPNGAHNGSFDPATDAPGTYTYTVTGLEPCPTATATVQVSISGPDAGFNSSLTVCSGQPPFSLFAALNGDPDVGGSWIGPGGPHSPLYDPGIHPGGEYIYTVVDGNLCADSSKVLIVNVPGPDPGDDAILSICDISPPVDLIDQLGGTPQAGGTWTGPDGPFDGSYDPATDPPGLYTYRVLGNPPCPFATATVTVNLVDPPDAGTDAELFTCDTITALNLITTLGGSPQLGGSWQDLDNSGAHNNGILNTNGLPAGEYRFLYTVAVAGCGTDQAQLLVHVKGGVDVSPYTRDCAEKLGTMVISFTISGGDAATYTVTGAPGTIEAMAPYRFTSDALPDSVEHRITITDQYACTPVLLVVEPCTYVPQVEIPQSFSPNGDGVNETFRIPGLEDFPGNEIHIFNRWGAKLYHAQNYHLERGWDGNEVNGAFGNGPLPAGTYFYVLDLGDGSKAHRGFVYLNR